MKNTVLVFFSLFALAMLVPTIQAFSQEAYPWGEKQLIEPAELAKNIRIGDNPRTYIYNIGPAGIIKNATDIGEGSNPANIAKLKKEVSRLPKNAHIVIYCGCCPFADCPNIQPAFSLLNQMKFTNHKLLHLSDNLKVDWIDKGYPMAE